MSAGTFNRSRYEDDNGNIWRVKVQPETEGLTIASVANAPPGGSAPAGFPSACVSAGRNTCGVNARLCRIRFTNTIPPGYKPTGTITLPILSLAAKTAFTLDATGTYTLEGTAYDVEIVGLTPESIK